MMRTHIKPIISLRYPSCYLFFLVQQRIAWSGSGKALRVLKCCFAQMAAHGAVQLTTYNKHMVNLFLWHSIKKNGVFAYYILLYRKKII